MLTTFKKAPKADSLGAFFIAWMVAGLFFPSVAAAASEYNCISSAPYELARLERVYDGDTLRLVDGRKVRLIGINTPELARDGYPEEALASIARDAVIKFFRHNKQLRLVFGAKGKDHYGRLLAHIYSFEGLSLESLLLSQGLAFHIAIPPNLALAACLRRAENYARRMKLGIWASPEWKPRDVKDLRDSDGGFRLIRGQVESVTENQYLWVKMDGPLVLRINRRDYDNFTVKDWQTLVGRQIEARGWLADRRDKTRIIAQGYARWRLDLHSSYAISDQIEY